MRAFFMATAFAAAIIVGPAAFAQTADGKKTFGLCRACHALDEGGSVETGPTLYGLFGRKAGTQPGFTYSDAMKKDVVWTPETLDAFLKNPQGFMPGNKMPFAGVKNAAQRAALIDYLKTATAAH